MGTMSLKYTGIKHFYRFHCKDGACGEPLTTSGRYFITSGTPSDAMDAGESNCTTDWKEVTCPKCKEWKLKCDKDNERIRALDKAHSLNHQSNKRN